MGDAPSNSGGTEGGTPQAGDTGGDLGWRAQLSPELQKDEYFGQFKKLDASARRHKELVTENDELKKKLEVRTVKIPDEQSTDDEKDEFYRKLGWPEKPEGYEIEPSFPAGYEGAQEFLTGFLNFCHENKVPKNIAKSLYGWYTAGLKETVDAQLQADQNSLRESIESRRNKWGEKHDVNMEIVRRGLKKFGVEDKDMPEFEKIMFRNPSLLDVVFFAGDQLREDNLIEGTFGEGNEESRKEYLKKSYPNSPELWS